MKVSKHCFAHLMLFLFSMPAWADTENGVSVSERPDQQVAALSVNEPIYFVVGGSSELKARFQFSFKYRIFEEDGLALEKAPWLRNLHFAFTQTSLWNLSDDSAPFEDSSYRPSFFFDIYRSSKPSWRPAFIRTGYEHESNGQAGAVSRSMDTAYIWPFWGGQYRSRDWFVAPKLWTYLAKGGENPDISEYRGYNEIYFQYGNEDSWLLAMKVRPGRLNHSAYQVELSWPTRKAIFSRTGGFLFLQYFDGYGENLLNYNERSDHQIRIGFAIVR